VACWKSFPQEELIRIAVHDKLDLKRELGGRGVYLCPKEDCIENACKKSKISSDLKEQCLKLVKG